MLFEHRNRPHQPNAFYPSALEYQVRLFSNWIWLNFGCRLSPNFVGFLSHSASPSLVELSRIEFRMTNVHQAAEGRWQEVPNPIPKLTGQIENYSSRTSPVLRSEEHTSELQSL